MMDLLFYDGRLAWPAVALVVYLTGLLLLCDYVWRTSRFGGKKVLAVTGAAGLVGSALVLFFL